MLCFRDLGMLTPSTVFVGERVGLLIGQECNSFTLIAKKLIVFE